MVIHFIFITGLVIIGSSLGIYLIEKLIMINDRGYNGGFWSYALIGPLIGVSIANYFNAKKALKNYEKFLAQSKVCRVKFCTQCGASVVSNAIFCTNCGKQIKE